MKKIGRIVVARLFLVATSVALLVSCVEGAPQIPTPTPPAGTDPKPNAAPYSGNNATEKTKADDAARPKAPAATQAPVTKPIAIEGQRKI